MNYIASDYYTIFYKINNKIIMKHNEIILFLLVGVLYIVVFATSFSLVEEKSNSFSLQDWIDLDTHFHWDEHPIPEFMNRK